ncbi:MAG TPA: GNAT family N-acetyltransferase [Tepidiformaceae bacterium]|nr:GNAT family N-acetyltransferase [Tepidiformaceae bacterium]
MTTPPSKRDLLERQIRNLFVVDDRGFMVRVNEPGERPPPLFYMGRASDGCVAFVSERLPGALGQRLLAAAAEEPPTDDFTRPPHALRVAAAIALEMRLAVTMRRGPAYAAAGDPPPFAIDGDVAPAAGQRLHPWIAERWHAATLPPLELASVVMTGGVAVALCHCARLGPHDAEAGVETAEEFRHRGYAAAATAAWVRDVRSSGRTAFYSTDWDNVASQGVARKLGLQLLGELSSVG